MTKHPQMHQLPGGRAPSSIPAFSDASEIPLCSVTNENWRGKNNPLERRRIQNRLNQRAFRQRQRASEVAKQIRRSTSRTSSDLDDEDDASPSIKRPPSEERKAQPRPKKATTLDATHQYPQWDELAQLINGNFMAAAFANAQTLGIDADMIRNGIPMVTQRPRPNVPAALQPVDLQYQFPHDPIIDIIPHPALRFNILRAIATRMLDPGVFSTNLRTSGVLFTHNGQRMRGGLVVWRSPGGHGPDQIESWELSEHFVAVWAFLLNGCEELISASNTWRDKRGERSLFPGLRTI